MNKMTYESSGFESESQEFDFEFKTEPY